MPPTPTFQGASCGRVLLAGERVCGTGGTPTPGATGAVTITVTVDDGGALNRTTNRSFLITVNSTNRSPIISAAADVASAEDTVAVIPFTVADNETSASNLGVAARSSNLALIPNTGLTLTGAGATRPLTAVPLDDQAGDTVNTLSAYDPDGGTHE